MSETAGPLRPDELLAETEWLRFLAAHLVRDPGAADDIAQETAIAALRHPPAGARRPWLAQVLRNFARQRHRGESRRARREDAVAARERDEPSPAELVERVETHRLIAEIVASLSEPNRAAIVLRYYEGLEPSEIAARLGVPAGTVRARIHRGLAELRERLDARHEGDRRAWLAALAPLAANANGAPWRGRSATPAAAGAGTLLVALGTASLVVVGVVAVWPGSDADPLLASAPGPSPASEPSRWVAPRARAEDTPPAAPTTPAPDRVRIAGRVVDESGAVVRDAEVTLRPVRAVGDPWEGFAASQAAMTEPDAAVRARSGADGAFALDAARGGRVSIVASAPGLASAAVAAEADRDLGDLTLRLAPALRLEGDVRDEAAAPIAGALVTLTRHPPETHATRTDATGRFVFDALAPLSASGGEDVNAIASAPGFAPVSLSAAIGRGRVQFVLPRGQIVPGRVLDAEGRPVAGCTVTIEPVAPSSCAPVSGRTDALGAFRIGPVGATVRFAFNAHVVTPDGAKLVVSSQVAPVPGGLDVRLPSTVTLKGRVIDADGDPVAGARVAVAESLWWTSGEFNGGSGGDYEQRTTTSDPDGSFSIRCGTDKASLRIASTDSRWQSDAVQVDVAARGSQPIELVAKPREEPGQRPPGQLLDAVRGRVEDAEGAGVPGALVAIATPEGVRTTRSAPDGAWSMEDVPVGSRVAAYADGRVPVRSGERGWIGEADVKPLVLALGSTVEGVVVDAEGAPVPAVLVRVNVQCGKGWTSAVARTDAAGAFRADGVPAGKATLWATSERGSETRFSIEVATPCAPLRLVMPRGFAIAGRVVGPDGAPLAAQYLTVRCDAANARGHTVTDAAGRFEVAGLPEGVYRVDVGRWVRALAVPAGTTDLDLRVAAPLPIAGRVLRPDGTPAAGTQVVLARDDGPPSEGPTMWLMEWTYHATADADGRYCVPEVFDGTYALYVQGAAGAASPVARGVRPGSEDVEVRLTAAAEVVGELVTSDGRPVPGFVELRPADGFGPVAYAQANDDGRFTVAAPATVPLVLVAGSRGNATRVRVSVEPPARGLRIEVPAPAAAEPVGPK